MQLITRCHLKIFLFASCVAASLVLVGCKSTGDVLGMFSGGSDSGSQSQDTQGKFIDSVKSDLNINNDSRNPKQQLALWQQDIGYVRYGNKTIANIPLLQNYVNDVLVRLHGGLRGKPTQVKIFITPQKNFEAYTLEHGAIFVSLGTLLALKNEDELAALLAHEYAHVLLSHHAKDTFELLTRYGMRYANVYLQASAESGREQKTQMRTLQIANWVSDKALFPNWNKGQENDADILAVDLVIQAGYNADAVIAMLKKVELTVLEKKEFIEQNPVKVSKKAKENSKLNVDLDVLAANAVGNLEQQLDRDYESAKVRQKQVRSYIKREYKKRARPSYLTRSYQAKFTQRETSARVKQYTSAHKAEQTLLDKQDLNQAARLGARSIGGSIGEDPYTRMLMYNIRNAQAYTDKAQINLNKAYATNGAPMYTYELLVKQHMEKKQFDQARILLEEMDAVFIKPDEILPNLITARKRSGKSTFSYLMRCLTSGDMELIKQCNQASGK
ncbi:MAG: M48 family metalloprotease [Gammaproteobacteria bacterium]|nr:M48 family metalloprotease [Gammaproteobacteria bacterium]